MVARKIYAILSMAVAVAIAGLAVVGTSHRTVVEPLSRSQASAPDIEGNALDGPESSSFSMDFALDGTNDLVSAADAAVKGEIVSVGAPLWNTVDGKPWTISVDDPAAKTFPMKYRVIKVRIDEVVFASEKLPVIKDDTVEVSVFGDGSATGAAIDGDLPDQLRWNNLSGPILQNEQYLVILRRGTFPMEGSSDTWPIVNLLVNHFQGVWHLTGTAAVSVDPRRSVADQELLVQGLREERATGPVDETPEEEGNTVLNPIAGAADTG